MVWYGMVWWYCGQSVKSAGRSTKPDCQRRNREKKDFYDRTGARAASCSCVLLRRLHCTCCHSERELLLRFELWPGATLGPGNRKVQGIGILVLVWDRNWESWPWYRSKYLHRPCDALDFWKNSGYLHRIMGSRENETYRPLFVMIISVPILWNCCHKSLFSNLASTPGRVGRLGSIMCGCWWGMLKGNIDGKGSGRSGLVSSLAWVCNGPLQGGGCCRNHISKLAGISLSIVFYRNIIPIKICSIKDWK